MATFYKRGFKNERIQISEAEARRIQAEAQKKEQADRESKTQVVFTQASSLQPLLA